METLSNQRDERRQPYIGVTGITTMEEAHAVATACRDVLGSAQLHAHRGMAGYLVRQQQVAGEPTRKPRFAAIEALPALLAVMGAVALNTLHYLAHGETPLSEQITALLSCGALYESGLCRTIQLNMNWPRPAELRRARDRHADLRLILQVSWRILRQLSPDAVAERLIAYQDVIDFVLLDPSGGAGRPFAASFIAPFYDAARAALPEAGIVLAGGFNADNVEHRLKELRAMLGSDRFCIDAEGGLRDRQDRPTPIDRLSITLVQGYLAGAARGFGASLARGA